MTNSVEVGASAIHGLGVFAIRAFAPGQTVHVLDDARVVDATFPLREEFGEYAYHCDYLADGRTVLMPAPERHINSSCDPNTYVKTVDGLRRVIALRSIDAGEEITYDYLINCHGGEVWQCRCGAARCRGMIASSFFELPLGWQREYLPLLDDWFVAEHAEKVRDLRERLRAAGPALAD